MIIVSAHEPRRPEWVCRCCGLPYPCPEARRALICTYGLTPELARRATDLLFKAVLDLDGVAPADLFDRFVAWTAPARNADRLSVGS